MDFRGDTVDVGGVGQSLERGQERKEDGGDVSREADLPKVLPIA